MFSTRCSPSLPPVCPGRQSFVVDNSEDEDIARCLREAAAGWRVHTMPNRGYGAAANAALKLIPRADLVLVVTHEVRVDRDCRRRTRPSAHRGAHGRGRRPRPPHDPRQGSVWSRGGILTRRSSAPAPHPQEPSHRGRPVEMSTGSMAPVLPTESPSSPRTSFRRTSSCTSRRPSCTLGCARGGGGSSRSKRPRPTRAPAGCPPSGDAGTSSCSSGHTAAGARAGWRPIYFTARTMAVSVVTGHWADIIAAPQGLFAGYRAARSGNRVSEPP